MTLPGFNAETSLYRTSVPYRLMGASVQAGGVMLQQASCFGRCARYCAGPPYFHGGYWFQLCYSKCIYENCE